MQKTIKEQKKFIKKICVFEYFSENDTAFKSASRWGHLEKVEYLVEKGADINALGGKDTDKEQH